MSSRSESFSGRAQNGLQGKAVKVLHSHHCTDWHELLERRARVLKFPGQGIPRKLPPSIDWGKAITVLRESAKFLGLPNVMLALKTWLNAWPTTERLLHDSAQSACVFCWGRPLSLYAM